MWLTAEKMPKRYLFDMFVNSWKYQRSGKGEILSWESQSSSNIVRFDDWVEISDGFEWFLAINFHKFSVPKICGPRLIQATYACHSEVSIRFFGLWSPRQIVVESCEVGPIFPCNKSHEAMNNCRDWVFSHSGFEVGLPAFQLPMCDALPKKDCSTCSMPFVKSI